MKIQYEDVYNKQK